MHPGKGLADKAYVRGLQDALIMHTLGDADPIQVVSKHAPSNLKLHHFSFSLITHNYQLVSTNYTASLLYLPNPK